MSYYHSTIHMTSAASTLGGIDLTITDTYEDESGIFTPEAYSKMIDSTGNGYFYIFDTVPIVGSVWIQPEEMLAGASYALGVEMPYACGGAKSTTISMSNRSYVVTDIEAIAIKPRFNIYPNPSSGIFQIESDQDINQIEIINIAGQVILSPKTNTIDLSAYSKGFYFAIIQTPLGISIEKLILQ